jgi:hypothetical protein
MKQNSQLFKYRGMKLKKKSINKGIKKQNKWQSKERLSNLV